MSNLALQRQRQWLWNILASLDDAVVATGMDGMVTFMNASAARLTGRDLGSTSPVALTELLHLADGRGMAAAEISLRPVLAEGRTIVVQGYLLREPALNPVPVSGAANPLLDQDGSPIGALVMLRDMTEALRIQQLMVESERLGVAAEMAAGVAHTVNNVLLIISGNAEALTRHLPPERQRQVENIHAGVRRISDLTARLLTFTDAGAENAGSVDLNDVIRSSVAQEGPFPSEVRMHLALSPSPIMVRGAAEVDLADRPVPPVGVVAAAAGLPLHVGERHVPVSR